MIRYCSETKHNLVRSMHTLVAFNRWPTAVRTRYMSAADVAVYLVPGARLI